MEMNPSDAVEIQEIIKSRIRRLSHMDNMDEKVFQEVSTLARMGLELVQGNSISKLSLEEFSLFMDLKTERMKAFFQSLNRSSLESELKSTRTFDPVIGSRLFREMDTIITD